MKIIACMRIYNEGLLLKDTLDYLAEYCDGILIYNDGSTDNSLEICYAHPAVQCIIGTDKRPTDSFLLQGAQRNRLIQVAKEVYHADWIVYQDCDERIDLAPNEFKQVLINTKQDCLITHLYDFYLTKDDQDYDGSCCLSDSRKWIGPEFRKIPIAYRSTKSLCIPNGPHRYAVGIKEDKVLYPDPIIYVKHYGKAISVQQWEETCDHYISRGNPEMIEKWSARKGKAIHTQSDFSNPLILWEDKNPTKDPDFLDQFIPLYQTLSLCLIGKNETDELGGLLSSIIPVVDEIIFVDTGSTDCTVEVAESFGCSIYHFDWNNNFSDARNFALSKATSDWIVVMDPDERIARSDLWNLRALSYEQADNIAFQLVTFNYTDSSTVANWTGTYPQYKYLSRGFTGWVPSVKCRVFKNDGITEFRGDIHEMVEESLRERDFNLVQNNSIPIHHYGKVRKDKLLDKEFVQLELGVKKVKEQPKNAVYWHELGVQYMTFGDMVNARDCFHQAISIRPEIVDPWYNLAIIALEFGDIEEAQQYFQETVDVMDSHHDAHNNLGRLLLNKGESDRAAHHFKSAIRYNPMFAQPYINLGLLHKDRGEIDKAIKLFESAIRINPNSVSALMAMSGVYADKADFNQAITMLGKALSIDDTNSDLYMTLAATYNAAGRIEDALKVLFDLVSIHPKLLKAYMYTVEIYIAHKQYELAIKICHVAIQKCGHNIDAPYFMLGNIYYAMGNKRKAKDNYDRVIMINTDPNTVALAQAAIDKFNLAH